MSVNRPQKTLVLCLALVLGTLSGTSGAAQGKENRHPAGLPEELTLRLSASQGISAAASLPGDEFVARVQRDHTDGQGNTLIARGSWVTGKVTSVEQPQRFSRSGKLVLMLDTLTRLDGSTRPLSVNLIFEEGKVNDFERLDPKTGFRDRALQPTQELLDSQGGKAIAVAGLGIPVVTKLVSGAVKAAISKGEDIGLARGEKFDIVVAGEALAVRSEE